MLRMDVVSVRVSSVVHELHPTLLKELDEHVEAMGSHDNLMLKKIVGCYTLLRVKCLIWQNYSYAKMHKNENSQNSQSFLALAFLRGICLSRHQRI